MLVQQQQQLALFKQNLRAHEMQLQSFQAAMVCFCAVAMYMQSCMQPKNSFSGWFVGSFLAPNLSALCCDPTANTHLHLAGFIPMPVCSVAAAVCVHSAKQILATAVFGNLQESFVIVYLRPVFFVVEPEGFAGHSIPPLYVQQVELPFGHWLELYECVPQHIVLHPSSLTLPL